jgi:hypothetical protein
LGGFIVCLGTYPSGPALSQHQLAGFVDGYIYWLQYFLMKIFITDIWMKKVGELPPHHGLLPFYYTDMVMRALQQRKIMPAIIPDGCTSILQPLDVSMREFTNFFHPYVCNEYLH